MQNNLYYDNSFLFYFLQKTQSYVVYNNLTYYFYIDGLSCSYFLTHLRFSTIMQPVSFIDNFAFNLNLNNYLLFYNFKLNYLNYLIIAIYSKNNLIFSAVSLFSNINWYEREIFELNGVYFFNKIDNRNLVLPYCFYEKPLATQNCVLLSSVAFGKNTIHQFNLNWVLL